LQIFGVFLREGTNEEKKANLRSGLSGQRTTMLKESGEKLFLDIEYWKIS